MLPLAAAAPKKANKKAKTPKKAEKPVKEEVETFRKADFVSSVQKKTGLSKVDSEAALQAVLETITEVCVYVVCHVSTCVMHGYLSSLYIYIYIAGSFSRKTYKLGWFWNL